MQSETIQATAIQPKGLPTIRVVAEHGKLQLLQRHDDGWWVIATRDDEGQRVVSYAGREYTVRR